MELNGTKVKLDDQKKDELLRKLCYLCERAKCTVYCKDFCKRAFHAECKNRVEAGDMNIDGIEKSDVEELTMSDEKLREAIDCNYTCLDCRDHSVICYICKVKGKYYGAEYHKKKANGNSGGSGSSANANNAGSNSVLRLVKKPADENE